MKLCNRKILIIAILVLCVVSLGFIGAVSAGNNQTQTNNQTATPTNVQLTISGITKPVGGATPTITSPIVTANSANLVKSVSGITWKANGVALQENTNFGYKIQYIAEFTVTLDNSISNRTITVNTPAGASSATILSTTTNVLPINVVYPATGELITSVAVKVTAPETGDKPTDATDESAAYKVSKTEWYKKGDTLPMSKSTAFEAENEYTVKVTLSTETGNFFDSSLDKTKATVNSNTAKEFVRDSDSSLTFSYTFAATKKLEGPAITFSLDPAPVSDTIYIPSNADKVTVTYKYTITGSPESATLDYGDDTTPVDLGSATSGTITGSKTHDFSTAGSTVYKAVITAKNAKGVTTTKEISFKIAKETLAAKFDTDKSSGTAPLSVKFTDKSTGTITSRTWDFGDGTYAYSGTTNSHTYNNPGTYTAKLTVSDGTNQKTATKTITVTAAATAKPTTTATATPTKTTDTKKTTATFEPFLTLGDLEIPSPLDIIAEFIHLFQSMFDFENYHVSSDAK